MLSPSSIEMGESSITRGFMHLTLSFLVCYPCCWGCSFLMPNDNFYSYGFWSWDSIIKPECLLSTTLSFMLWSETLEPMKLFTLIFCCYFLCNSFLLILSMTSLRGGTFLTPDHVRTFWLSFSKLRLCLLSLNPFNFKVLIGDSKCLSTDDCNFIDLCTWSSLTLVTGVWLDWTSIRSLSSF